MVSALLVGSMLSTQGPLFGVALATCGGTMRTAVYVDGFNLYYGALKGTPFRWLNIDVLMPHLLPAGCNVISIKYFTARVSGSPDIDAPRRQAIYLKALRTIPYL
jgi:hypothetical protein